MVRLMVMRGASLENPTSMSFLGFRDLCQYWQVGIGVGRTTHVIYAPCQIFRKCTRCVPSLIITQEVDLRHQDDFFMCPDVRRNPSDKCYQSLRLLCTHTYMPIREVTRGIESPPISLSFVCVLVVNLRPQRIQSHSSNSIITATDSKHVATALSLSLSLSLRLPLSSCLFSCSWSIYDHSTLNRTLLRRHCRAQQTPNHTALTNKLQKKAVERYVTKTKSVQTTSCHRLTWVATGWPLLHWPLLSPTPQNLRHKQTDVMNLYIKYGNRLFFLLMW